MGRHISRFNRIARPGFGPDRPLRRWHDAAVQSVRAAIPGSCHVLLDELSISGQSCNGPNGSFQMIVHHRATEICVSLV